jgi:hypothetical protein
MQVSQSGKTEQSYAAIGRAGGLASGGVVWMCASVGVCEALSEGAQGSWSCSFERTRPSLRVISKALQQTPLPVSGE